MRTKIVFCERQVTAMQDLRDIADPADYDKLTQLVSNWDLQTRHLQNLPGYSRNWKHGITKREKPILPDQAYKDTFFDLVEQYLPEEPKDPKEPIDRRGLTFAKETREQLEKTNAALHELNEFEKHREEEHRKHREEKHSQSTLTNFQPLTNLQRAEHLFSQLSGGEPADKALQYTAYLVRAYLPFRKWQLEDVGYFFKIALEHELKTVEMPTYMERKLINTLNALAKRVQLPSPPPPPL